MNNKRFYIIIAFFIVLATNNLYCQNKNNEPKKSAKRVYSNHKKMIPIDYSDKPLTEIINDLAAEKKINIILPQGALAIPTKITYHLTEALTLDEAWQQLTSMLNISGYTIEPEGNMQIIKKIDQNINRQILSVYIAEPLDTIPDDENIIRTVFYLANINLKSSWNDLNAILKDMLSPTADIRSDPKVNALILTDKATNIKATMRIIFELDKGGLRDSIQVIPLYYTSSSLVEKLFNQQLLAQKAPQPGAGGTPTPEQVSYFPKNTKIIGLDRNNTLVIMGTPYAIDLVKDFIIKYIDRPLESGHSILHIYDLQYLNAQTFAPILQQILTPAQAEQAAGQVVTGPKQYFKDVIVQAEITSKTEEIKPTTVTGEATIGAQPVTEGAQVGGNRLVIAARKKDWVRIRQLIEDLDKPQPQVALEVIVADVTLNSNKFLGSQMRNKQGWNDSISKGVDFQSAQLNQPILTTDPTDASGLNITPANALMSNLLQLGDPFPANENLATAAPAGSLVFSLGDKTNGVWSFWQILNAYTNATLIAQPFVITKNHQQATVTISQQRYLAGKADTSNVAVNVGNEWVTAAFTIDILPHISTTGNINLQITVKINEFIADAASGNNTRLTRLVQTNSNVGNNEILALGGLTRETVRENRSEIPPFSKIPIFGWFFKKVQKIKERNNLIILISPTIIEPKLKGGIDHFTDQKLAYAKDQIDESVCYENLKDPITRWFFQPDPFYAEDVINDYTQRTQHEIYNQNGSTMVEDDSSANEAPISIPPKAADEIKELVKDEENPLVSSANSDNQSSDTDKAKTINRQKKHENNSAQSKTTQLKDLIKDEKNPLIKANLQEVKEQVRPQS